MDDCISRQAAIDALADYIHNVDKVMGTGHLTEDDCKDAATSVFEELPTVQTERKKGKWIHDIKKRRLHVIDPKVAIIEVIFHARPKCSECGFEIAHETHFCPNCGARMEGT